MFMLFPTPGSLNMIFHNIQNILDVHWTGGPQVTTVIIYLSHQNNSLAIYRLVSLVQKLKHKQQKEMQ